jgi:hypothetical protein
MKKTSLLLMAAVMVWVIGLPVTALADNFTGYVNGLEINANAGAMVMINDGPNGSGQDIQFAGVVDQNVIIMLISLQANQLQGYFSLNTGTTLIRAGAWMDQQPSSGGGGKPNK